ncbi:MAG: hypothetical protein ACFHU9_16865 [Fluviicola sp.]
MKNSLNILMLVGVLILTSCSNYNNFQKRKYTRGIFRPKTERLKAYHDKEKSEEVLRTGQHAEVLENGKKPFEIQTRTHSENFEAAIHTDDLNQSEERRTAVRDKNLDIREQKQGSQVAQTEVKKKEKRKSLTSSEKNAKSAFILGVTSIGLITTLFAAGITLGILSVYFFPILALARLPALLGFIGLFKGSLFFRQDPPLEGKYQKYRRRGLFLSFLTVVIWLLFFLF